MHAHNCGEAPHQQLGGPRLTAIFAIFAATVTMNDARVVHPVV